MVPALTAVPVPAAAAPPAVAVAATLPAANQPRVATLAPPALPASSAPLQSPLPSQTHSSMHGELATDKLASTLSSMSLGDLRRQFFFVDAHVFHTRYVLNRIIECLLHH
jgi:hypothetical protein